MGSASLAKQTRSLSRLLKGRTSFSESVEDDIIYLQAAYRTGSFSFLSNFIREGLQKDEFLSDLNIYMDVANLTPISFYHKDKMIGIGLFNIRGRMFETSNLIWFKWASPRMVLEAYVNFVNNIRKEIHIETGGNYFILEYAEEKDAKFFDHICSYGIMRRVGTSYEVYPNKKCCVYESRGVI